MSSEFEDDAINQLPSLPPLLGGSVEAANGAYYFNLLRLATEPAPFAHDTGLGAPPLAPVAPAGGIAGIGGGGLALLAGAALLAVAVAGR